VQEYKILSKGIFITLEGIDGSGKSTQAKRLNEYLCSQGYPVVCTREPGGTILAEAIRSLLLEPRYGPVEARAEVFLYAAARIQHVAERILPALAEGKIVLCDRFVDSSLAYQGFGRGLGVELVREVNNLAIGGLKPDLTIIIDVPVVVGIRRRKKHAEIDRLEQEDLAFHRRVREGYLEIANSEPGRVRLIDGNRKPEEVWLQVEKSVIPVLKDYKLNRK